MTAEYVEVNPADLLRKVHLDGEQLDTLTKRHKEATDRLDQAEDAWERIYDRVADSLKEEMAEEGRKGDPAEHWIVSRARREHRSVWQEFRRAKREVERLQRQAQTKRSAASSRQSELNALRDELRAAA